MQIVRSLTLTFGLAYALTFVAPVSAQASGNELRTLVITGGHGFETNQFFNLFQTNSALSCQFASHPNVDFWFSPSNKWDVIVLYDYNAKISDDGKTNFLAQLKAGAGLVVLHHAIVAFPAWDEYRNIIGARYYLAATNINGVEKKRSGFTHGLDFTIHIADPDHPVTRGVKDFAIHDETYRWFDVFDDCRPLLTTDEPQSNKVIGWAKTYGNARVVFIQSGHDHFAWDNPNFQKILNQAMHWTARKD